MSVESKAKVTQIFGDALCNTMGSVILEYIVMTMPEFTGTTNDLFELFYSFLVGVVEEEPLRGYCERLMDSFGKLQEAEAEDTSKLSVPVRMKDLFVSEPTQARRNAIEFLPSEYLYGKADQNRRKGPKPPQKKKTNDFVMSPATFFVNRASRAGMTRDLTIDNVDVSVVGRQLIKNSSLKLVAGRRYGLVGRNGAGKSTLLRAISSRELDVPKHLDILHVEQEVMGDDTPVLASVLASDVERASLLAEEKRIISLPKGDPNSLMQKELDASLAKVYTRLAEIHADEAEARAAKILVGLGFDAEAQKRPTREFSGGWRMRLALARALFCDPDVLLLDEPTNMLDVRTVIWLENYLRKWDKTVLVVSHDRQFLDNVTTDVIHLSTQTLTTYPGNYESFQHTRSERIKNQARMREAQESQRAHIQAFVDKFRYNAKRASLVQSRLKRLEKMDVIPEVLEDPTLFFTFPNCTSLRPPIIQFQDVEFGYTPDKILFSDVNFSIDQESRIAIVGSNGMGKSTLLNLIAGDIEATKGFLFRHGRLKLARFSQHHVDTLDLDLTCVEFFQKSFPGKDSQAYRNFLGKYGVIGEMANQKIETLSGGQKSRLVFAYMAMQEPQIMILDEPANHLDIETVDVLCQAINAYNGGVVIISHDERLITHCCDEVWILANRQVNRWEGDFDSYKAQVLKEIDLDQ
jgi:ATP-binding cassette subfamily F protein 3